MNTAVSGRDPDQGRTVAAHATLAPFIAGAWVFSIGYEILLGRHLTPSDYGVFETLVGVLAVPGVIAAGVQLLLARAAAGAGDGPAAWRRAWQATALTGVVMAALSAPLASVLRIPLPALLASAVLAASWVLLSAMRGVVQGSERYLTLGLSFVVENGGRFVGTFLLMRHGYWGALLAVAGGTALALLALAPGVRAPLGRASRRAAADGRDLLLYVLGSALVAALPALPLLALRQTLSTTAFAALAAMALLGRGEAQIGGWLTQALYPRLVASGNDASVFRITLWLALGISGAVALAAALLMPQLMALAFAGRYDAYLGTFRLFVFATLPVALLALWATRAMAARDGRGLAVLGLSIPLQAALLWSGRLSGFSAALAAEAVPSLTIVALSLLGGAGGARPAPIEP